MTVRNRSFIAMMLGLTLVVASTGVAQDTPPKSTVGDKFDSAVQSLKKGAQEATETVRQQYERARGSIHNMGVASRVYGRLHWDKALAGSKVEVDVRKDGVAVLTGSVADPKARAKAVELTRDTVGVTQVMDQLTVQTSVTPAPVTGTVTKP